MLYKSTLLIDVDDVDEDVHDVDEDVDDVDEDVDDFDEDVDDVDGDAVWAMGEVERASPAGGNVLIYPISNCTAT